MPLNITCIRCGQDVNIVDPVLSFFLPNFSKAEVRFYEVGGLGSLCQSCWKSLDLWFINWIEEAREKTPTDKVD